MRDAYKSSSPFGPRVTSISGTLSLFPIQCAEADGGTEKEGVGKEFLGAVPIGAEGGVVEHEYDATIALFGDEGGCGFGDDIVVLFRDITREQGLFGVLQRGGIRVYGFEKKRAAPKDWQAIVAIPIGEGMGAVQVGPKDRTANNLRSPIAGCCDISSAFTAIFSGAIDELSAGEFGTDGPANRTVEGYERIAPAQPLF